MITLKIKLTGKMARHPSLRKKNFAGQFRYRYTNSSIYMQMIPVVTIPPRMTNPILSSPRA